METRRPHEPFMEGRLPMSKKKFKGVWLPVALLNDDRLTLSEKLLIGFTQSFNDRCFASDEHMANMLGISQKTVANCLSSLRKKGVIAGRDFPKTGTPLPENGNETSRKREHRSKVDQSEKEREKTPSVFSYENPEDVGKLISLLADRGFGEELARRAVWEVIGDLKAGIGEPPRNWGTFCANRCRRIKRQDYLAARAAKAAKPAPVSQFARTYN